MIELQLTSLLLTAGLYISILFGLAHCTEKGWIPKRLIKHPFIYVLSLGVSISTWSFFSAIISASDRGYGYTAYYLGYAAAFLFAPIVLQPILHLTRTYQLSSLADLFAFRFRSPWAGTLTTIVLLLCTFPLLIIPTIILESSIKVLVPEANTYLLIFIFYVFMLLFTLIFGAKGGSGRDNHEGVVIAMAFESILKIFVLACLFIYIIFYVFDGFNSLDLWLQSQTSEITRLDVPFLQNSTNLVILLFFTAAITMPHMFHMVFRENSNPANLKVASWGVPLFLLIASLPVLPILWASIYLDSTIELQYSALAIGALTDSPLITLITFLGGFAACFGISVVLTMAMSGMCVNHLLLPIHKPDANTNLYQWLMLQHRLFISAILLGGFGFYLLIAGNFSITDVSYVSFIACLQFLPGLLTLLFWPDGNSKGFICGLIAGVTVWLLLGLIPMFSHIYFSELSINENGQINWNMVTTLSLLSNIIIFVTVSLVTKTSNGERTAARLCIRDPSSRSNRMKVIAKTPKEFIESLATPLGYESAEREIQKALKELGISATETSPHSMHQLRTHIGANLSGLLGPTLSHQIIEHSLPYTISSSGDALNLGFIERRLESYPGNLSGVAQDLDTLRRHHRQILQDLPIGICSLNTSSEIAIWNNTMEKLTSISSSDIVGSHPSALSAPWKDLLIDFIEDVETPRIHKQSIYLNNKQHWLSLYKAHIENARGTDRQQEGLVILVEDLTDTELLESELAHSERLASIGRLAAGVAHEIGNPITGIACLAQNIRDETTNKELRQMAEQIIEQTNRTSRIVQSLVTFSHSGTRTEGSSNTNKETVLVKECAADAIQLLSLNQRSKDISFINDCNADSKIHSDQQRIQQVFVNLLSNARDASPSGSTISVTDSISDKHISITITDQGEGIPESIQDRIFEPFFTTKEPGKGTGLGLSLVYSIIEDLGGTIKINSPVNKVSKTGTRVIVTFPCYDG